MKRRVEARDIWRLLDRQHSESQAESDGQGTIPGGISRYWAAPFVASQQRKSINIWSKDGHILSNYGNLSELRRKSKNRRRIK